MGPVGPPGDRREHLVGDLARVLRLRSVEPGLRQPCALLEGEGWQGHLRDGGGALADGRGVELVGGDRRLDEDAGRALERLLRAGRRWPVDAVEQGRGDLEGDVYPAKAMRIGRQKSAPDRERPGPVTLAR